MNAVNVIGFCGGGLFVLLSNITGIGFGGFLGAGLNGFICGVLGYIIFGGITAFVLAVLKK